MKLKLKLFLEIAKHKLRGFYIYRLQRILIITTTLLFREIVLVLTSFNILLYLIKFDLLIYELI
jgi:hypothetical protein